MAVLRIVTQLAADIADMHHHEVVGRIIIRLVPDTFIDILCGKDFARMRGHQIQDAVLEICQRHFFPILQDIYLLLKII